jgi:hypothetical protein
VFSNIKLGNQGNRVFLVKVAVVIHIVEMHIVHHLSDPMPFIGTCVLMNVEIWSKSFMHGCFDNFPFTI